MNEKFLRWTNEDIRNQLDDDDPFSAVCDVRDDYELALDAAIKQRQQAEAENASWSQQSQMLRMALERAQKEITRLTEALSEAHAKNVEWSQVCDALDKRVDELEEKKVLH